MIDDRKILVLCITRVNDHDAHQLITALNNHLPDESWRLLVYSTTTDLYWGNPSETGEIAIFDLINYEATDAVVVFDEKIKNKKTVEDIISKSKQHNIPVISIGKSYDGAMITKFDYNTGFASMVRHVIEEHHVKKLHFMAGMEGNEFSDERMRVFADVIEQHGIPFDMSMVSYGDFWRVPAREATEKLVAEGRVPEAIVCANDAMAISCATVLREHGYKIPENVIVTGFDGIEDVKFSIPRMTSCVCSYEKMAEGICEVIADSGKFEKNGVIHIMPTLLLSESCGCNKEPSVNAADQLFSVNNQFYRFQEDEYKMYEMIARVSSCHTIKDVINIIGYKDYFYDMNIVLNKECLDETVDPLKLAEREFAYGETALQFIDTDTHEYGEIIEFKTADLLPDLATVLKYQKPVIFYGLHFLDVPLGYVCFHFHTDDIDNYIKIPQAVNSLNNAIGSYRNMRYQQYMTWQIEELYKLDNLTGLYNRNGFIREYTRITSLPEEQRSHLTVIMTDLDGLKYINDIFGHDEGDSAIKTVAQALKACCPEEALCVRFGGDEMLAVYNGVIDEQKIKADIAAYLDAYNAESGKQYKVSSSVGVQVLTSADNVDLDELIKKSDKLMYFDKAKKKGLLTESANSPE